MGLLVALLWGGLACDEGGADGPSSIFESTPVCAVPGHAPQLRVYPRLDVIGPFGNALVSGADSMWIVESGSNTVSRRSKSSGVLDEGFVDVGNDRNPYGIFVDEAVGELFVTNFAANTLTVASTRTGVVRQEISHPSFKNPSGVVATGTTIYVVNVNYLGQAEGYGPGSVSIVDRASLEVLGSIETAHKNPQYVTRLETLDGPRIAISNGGALRFGSEGLRIESEGSLELWEETPSALEPKIVHFAIGQLAHPERGALGQAMITADGRFIYAASGISPVLFKFDVANKRWIHASNDPLVLNAASGDATHAGALDARGLLYVTSFNQDALYVFDTACDKLLIGPIDLGITGDMLEGPQAIALDEQGEQTDAYFIMSVSNAIGKVTVAF
ncbi:MAG: hypothetical protein H0U74_19410 [Bradymonadaceae bacterium]|nr:hypothetical protein [Lujinxingiaceae bacterium]